MQCDGHVPLNILTIQGRCCFLRYLTPKNAVQLMDMCDALRDGTMVDLGIRMEDKPGGAVWKRDDPEALKRDLAEKRRAQAEAALKKVSNNLERARGDLEKVRAVLAFGSVAEKLGDRYRFDGAGAPTHGKQADGEWTVRGSLIRS